MTLLNIAKQSDDAALFPAADFWHIMPHSQQVLAGFKEWSHFSVLGADFDMLVNFSLMTGARSGSRMAARLSLLFRGENGTWDGDVESFGLDETAIAEGSPDTILGRSSARFAGRRYHVEVALSVRDILVTLDLYPVTRPLVAHNARLSAGESFRWMVVPHLRAEGDISVSGRHYPVVDAPAYHDRNSGCFTWGGEYAWEWAAILPQDASEPWCLVYSRIANRQRGATLSQSLLLWRCESLSRKFYGRDLSISHRGVLRRKHVLRLPRVASLLMPGVAADVPQQISASAQGYGDEVTLQILFDDFAQIVVPNDRWPGFTSLCEIKGRAEVTGRIGDESIAFEGRVQAEFNHAAS